MVPNFSFDATGVAPNTGFEPVPAGWYNVAISESEIKPTAAGDGAYLQLKAAIMDGEYQGRFFFIILNVQNKNQVAVDIAYGELSAIMHCINVLNINESNGGTGALHNKPFQVRVIVRAAKGDYDASNDIKQYKDASGNDPTSGQTQGGQQQGNQSQNNGQPDNNQSQQNNQNQGGQFQGNAPTEQNQGQQNQGGNAGWQQGGNTGGQGNQGNQGGNAPWGNQNNG